ncbi:MAG: T9SS type A sorting domain-containing protein, partial [Bacteroidia bacterium]|nr:T9SS type A sorting domain-containing protein [Bacteroidia bacterium]
KTLEINNSIGEKIVKEKFSEQKHNVNISALAPGIYFITVTDEQGNKAVRKVVKM